MFGFLYVPLLQKPKKTSKMGTTITKEAFLNASLSQISQVYHGKRNCCRCGCGGDYTRTSYSKHAERLPEDVDDNLVEKRLNRAKKLVQEGADFDAGDTYFDVETGNDRTLTFYFDDLKNI